MIQTRKLGFDGPYITEVGLGTWAIGGSWQFGWGRQNIEESKKAIQQAIESGVNWIDTAPAYGLGLSESIVGDVLSHIKNDIFVATKCGLLWNSSGKIKKYLDPQSIIKECDDSLRRLKRDYIDLYQIHWPDENRSIEKSWETMAKLKDSGKVRFIGVSNFSLEQLEKCEKIAHITSLQSPYSMLKRSVESEILNWCKDNQTGFLAYSPLQAGLLTGKFNKDYLHNLDAEDWRKKNDLFKEPLFSQILQFVDSLKLTAKKIDQTVAGLAVAWVLQNLVVTSAIVGVRNEFQANKLKEGLNWKLSDLDLREIEANIVKYLSN